jgi:hypothetical protein
MKRPTQVRGEAGVMGGAELDRETEDTVAGMGRFGGHTPGTRDEIRPTFRPGGCGPPDVVLRGGTVSAASRSTRISAIERRAR